MPKTETKSSQTTHQTASRPRGPVLVWNAERDTALALAIRGGAKTAREAMDAVADTPAFAAVREALTEDKVRLRLSKLRSKGAKIPEFQRSFYKPDIASLNELLS